MSNTEINVWTVLAGFMALCCAEGLATELTKRAHTPRSYSGRILRKAHRKSLLRAASLLGQPGTLNGYPYDRRLCDWWGPSTGATVGCCEACCRKYVYPVTRARKARNRKVRINWGC